MKHLFPNKNIQTSDNYNSRLQFILKEPLQIHDPYHVITFTILRSYSMRKLVGSDYLVHSIKN